MHMSLNPCMHSCAVPFFFRCTQPSYIFSFTFLFHSSCIQLSTSISTSEMSHTRGHFRKITPTQAEVPMNSPIPPLCHDKQSSSICRKEREKIIALPGFYCQRQSNIKRTQQLSPSFQYSPHRNTVK